MARHRGKKDDNHDEISEVFKSLGCSVASLHNTGLAGWPDVVVGVVGVNRLVEIKNPDTAYGRKGLNQNQTAFAQEWRGDRVWVVSSRDEAIALVQNWRRS